VQPVIGAGAQEIPRLNQLLMNIPDDRADLFYRLFDCTQAKKREERFEQFMKTVFPRLFQTLPNFPQMPTCIVEQLQQNPAVYQRFRDPALPLGLARVKGSKPIYKNFSRTRRSGSSGSSGPSSPSATRRSRTAR
jgi:hypothetical protein